MKRYDKRYSKEEVKWLKKWGIHLPYDVFDEAMTHPVYKNIEPDAKDYERFEFLGDAVLDLLTADYLFNLEKKYTEGIMTQKRSRMVNNEYLSEIFDKLGLKKFIRTEKNTI